MQHVDYEFCVTCALFVTRGLCVTCERGRYMRGSVHSWRLYSAASLGTRATGIKIRSPSQSHYPYTKLGS